MHCVLQMGFSFSYPQPSHGASCSSRVEVAHKEQGLVDTCEATGNDRFYLTELSPSTSSLAFPAGFFLGYNVTGQDFRGMDMMIFDGGWTSHPRMSIFQVGGPDVLDFFGCLNRENNMAHHSQQDFS